jgi:hypothetical protein
LREGIAVERHVGWGRAGVVASSRVRMRGVHRR